MYRSVLVLLTIVPCALGHGYLVYPPARNSMWREGFKTPKNYNDMGLNCGGMLNQWKANDGKCGLCGDPFQNASPRAHEAGGTYAPTSRPISRCYNTKDHVIDIKVRITAYHKGYFEFRLCVNNDISTDPSQACIDNGYLLNIAGNPGVTRYDINEDKREFYDFQLDLPQGVVCSQCILQWKYNAGNNWGCNDDGCGMGIGEQEQFINCADIAIVPDCEDPDDDGTDDTDSETDTTTSPVTDSVITGVPTAGPGFLCHAVGEWANLPYMDGWCNFHCLNPMLKICPATHCLCGSDLSSRNW